VGIAAGSMTRTIKRRPKLDPKPAGRSMSGRRKRNTTMKTLLAALVATIAVAGVAGAQQAPQLIGNYSDNVLQAHNGNGNGTVVRSDAGGVDFTSTASIAIRRAQDGGHGSSVSEFDIRSGR
jgi:hypothetical protein